MKYIVPSTLICALLSLAGVARAQSEPPSRCMNCVPEPTTTVPNIPTADDGAARRAREAAAADELRRAEAGRVERERLAAEKKRKDEEFIRNRDATAITLKGSIGTRISANNGGLKGGSTVSTGLRELHGSDLVARDLRGPQAAWKQLHCAAALSGYALAAVTRATPDYQESSFLIDQAGRAMSGQTLGVECPATQPFPDMHGRTVDMEKVKESETKILTRAAVIVERMKQRSVAATTSTVPVKDATETPDEKMRRVQRELNDANSVKVTGKTRQEIDQQERDRKELAKLIIANGHLEKGELAFVTVNASDDEAASTKTRRKTAPARH